CWWAPPAPLGGSTSWPGGRWPPALWRWPCRWGPTTPTTTATASGGPTAATAGSGPCGWSGRGCGPPGPGSGRRWRRSSWPAGGGARAGAAAAGWFYPGGPRPYGYLGLGELFVFVFFGVVATAGSAYVQEESLGLALAASVPVGLLATALLVVNNLRDIPGDTASGKRT